MIAEKIAELKEILISQANLVELMLDKTMKSLMKKDTECLNQIIINDENIVNNLENKIDELCMNIIARFHPEAKDLRLIMMIAKMTADLEKMADCAVNIAESALFLIAKPQINSYLELPQMADETIRMVKDSINAFINEEVVQAKTVCERDNIVDELGDKILEELIVSMTADASTIERSLHILRIASNLEKIADVSTNISEETVYIAKGKVIKHYQDSV